MERKLKTNSIDFRNRHGLSSIEPIQFKSLLQRLDVIILFKEMSENFSGVSIKCDEHMFMLINSGHSKGRQHFTIAHEIYHFFYDKTFKPHICQTGLFPSRNEQERYADIFASHLLLPEDGLLQLIPDNETIKDSIKIATILKLEQAYGASRSTLLYQLLKMGLITRKFKDAYFSNVKLSARQFGYPISLYETAKESSIIGTYGALANKLFDEEKISEGHFNELMLTIGIDLDDLFEDEAD